MVKIRLQRQGRRNHPSYRIVVTDVRVKRQGDYIEKIGLYDPIEKSADKQLVIDAERAQYWQKQGAQATPAVASLLKRKGVAAPAAK